MSDREQKVLDGNEVELNVGDRVRFYPTSLDGIIAEITKITDYDVDYDDEIMRPRMYPPIITVKYDDGTLEEWKTYEEQSLSYLGNIPRFTCEELEKVVDYP